MNAHDGGHGNDPGQEAVLDEIVDLEEYARAGKQPPLAKGYRLKINGKPYVITEAKPTGAEILTLAGLVPVSDYTLRLKSPGEQPRKIALDEHVDLREKGIEKFKALPRDQTEG